MRDMVQGLATRRLPPALSHPAGMRWVQTLSEKSATTPSAIRLRPALSLGPRLSFPAGSPPVLTKKRSWSVPLALHVGRLNAFPEASPPARSDRKPPPTAGKRPKPISAQQQSLEKRARSVFSGDSLLLFVTWTSEGYLGRLFLGDDGLLPRHDADTRGVAARFRSLKLAAWVSNELVTASERPTLWPPERLGTSP